MARLLNTLVLVCAAVSVPVSQSRAAALDDGKQIADGPSDQSANQVVQWNKTLLVIVRTAGAQPATIHPTRSFAMMHAAIYDAVNAIDGTHTPYLVHLTPASPSASPDAAAAAAAHRVLVTLYPAFQTMLDAQFQQSLAQIPEAASKAEGISIGETVADRILASRSTDGSDAHPIHFVFGNAPGDYQSTPPNFPPQPQFTHWAAVVPFALQRADQFRPGPPPALTSDAYGKDFNEVQALGVVDSTASSADQALTGRFWNGPIQNYWNEITQTAVVQNNLTTPQSARLFALLDLTIADAVIAFYDAKYTYNFWRPVTAIRAADTDNNPETLVDPNWLPEVGNSVSSEVLPGVERSFQSFSAAAEEATLSRIFAGVHFRSDLTSGQALGGDVAHFVLDSVLTPVAGPCVGDCGGSGMVNISDLITGVNIALGSLPASACSAFETAQGKVDIAQLIKGVNNALNDCHSG